MAPKTAPTTIRSFQLPVADDRQLEALAAAEDRSVSAELRRAITAHLQRPQRSRQS